MVMSQLQSRISILQHNAAKMKEAMYSILETATRFLVDFVILQEPWIAKDNISTISQSAYYCILPTISNNIRPRVAIYARKQSRYSFCHRTDLTADTDIIIIDVSGPDIETFQIINIYNERSLDPDSDSTSWTVERSLQDIELSKETLILGDFNAHHSWWNSSVNNSIRSDSLISWLNKFNLELINKPDKRTCTKSATSVIDLSFATQDLYQSVTDWCILDKKHATGSDHEVIQFYIRTSATELVDNSLCTDFFNLKKADWKLFSEELLLQANCFDTFSYIDLNAAAKLLQDIIYAAAEKSIPKRRISENSKFWWSDKLTNLRENFSSIRRK